MNRYIKKNNVHIFISSFLCLSVALFASGVDEKEMSDIYATKTQIEKRAQHISDNFMYILPDGKIHPAYSENKEKLQAMFSPDIAYLKTSDFYSQSFTISEITKGQIPHIHLQDATNWQKTDAQNTEQSASGENFSALGFKTRNVQYFRYTGENPLFSSTSEYNTMSYTGIDAITEKVLKRFLFYRWTGNNMGIPLDTYMYAIDTYTGLVFTYVKIGDWKGAFGVEVPTRYDPIEMYKAEDGEPHLFFEYDPIGYISKEKELVLYDWYIEKTKEKLSIQLAAHHPVGKSPYYEP